MNDIFADGDLNANKDLCRRHQPNTYPSFYFTGRYPYSDGNGQEDEEEKLLSFNTELQSWGVVVKGQIVVESFTASDQDLSLEVFLLNKNSV